MRVNHGLRLKVFRSRWLDQFSNLGDRSYTQFGADPPLWR